jgi:hypothetical protein
MDLTCGKEISFSKTRAFLTSAMLSRASMLIPPSFPEPVESVYRRPSLDTQLG